MPIRCGILLVALVVFAGCNNSESDKGSAGPSNAASKTSDAAAIVGTWNIVGVVDDGRVIEADRQQGSTLEIAADGKMVMKQSAASTPRQMTYKLDEANKRIDTTHVEPKRQNVGIYELKGDDLRLCLNDDESSRVYPTEFKSEKDKGKSILMTLRRAMK